MKKNNIIIISIMIILILGSLCSYVLLGTRSIFFRVSILILLLAGAGALIILRTYFQKMLKRGKQARVKFFESIAILFFGVAFYSLISSFDFSIDWTEQGLFQFSPQTKTLVKSINAPLKIT
ncbi:MAG: hypothetical protein ACRCTJ_00115, partial [Brevinema sp.]